MHKYVRQLTISIYSKQYSKHANFIGGLQLVIHGSANFKEKHLSTRRMYGEKKGTVEVNCESMGLF